MHDFLLGGTDNFAADREAIGVLLRSVPNAATGARENRAFLGEPGRPCPPPAEVGYYGAMGRKP